MQKSANIHEIRWFYSYRPSTGKCARPVRSENRNCTQILLRLARESTNSGLELYARFLEQFEPELQLQSKSYFYSEPLYDCSEIKLMNNESSFIVGVIVGLLNIPVEVIEV